MRPTFCPNCGARLPEGKHGAAHLENDNGAYWDIYCDTCRRSGLLFPDDESSDLGIVGIELDD